MPTDAGISIHREWLLIGLRTDWTVGGTTYPAGTLLATDYDDFLAGTAELRVVFEPDEHTSLHSYAWTRDRLILSRCVDVASRVDIVTPGTWTREPVAGTAAPTPTPWSVDADEYGDEFFLDSSGFDIARRACCGGTPAAS